MGIEINPENKNPKTISSSNSSYDLWIFVNPTGLCQTWAQCWGLSPFPLRELKISYSKTYLGTVHESSQGLSDHKEILASYSAWGHRVRHDLSTPQQRETCASQVVHVVKNLPANAGDVRDEGSTPGSGRSPEGGHGNPLQYSCLENLMDWGAWRAIVHGVSQNWTGLNRLSNPQTEEYLESWVLQAVIPIC